MFDFTAAWPSLKSAQSIPLPERGQMAVEIAIIAPVILVVMVVIIDMLVFTSECARFDHVASQAILANTTTASDSDEDASNQSSAIQSVLESSFAHNGSSVSVSCSDANQIMASMVVYTCELDFVPWPLSASGAPALLTHSFTLAVDPYTPGALI